MTGKWVQIQSLIQSTRVHLTSHVCMTRSGNLTVRDFTLHLYSGTLWKTIILWTEGVWELWRMSASDFSAVWTLGQSPKQHRTSWCSRLIDERFKDSSITPNMEHDCLHTSKTYIKRHVHTQIYICNSCAYALWILLPSKEAPPSSQSWPRPR